MVYTDIQKIKPESFQDYLDIDRHSFHSLLYADRPFSGVTNKMKIGKLVDAILTKQPPPTGYHSDEDYSAAKSIAKEISDKFGDSIIKNVECQAAFIGTINDGVFKLPVKGILVWYLEKKCVIDLKVTFNKVKDRNEALSFIRYMKYDYQIFNYMNLGECGMAYIMLHSVPNKKTFFFSVSDFQDAESWWLEQVLKYGII